MLGRPPQESDRDKTENDISGSNYKKRIVFQDKEEASYENLHNTPHVVASAISISDLTLLLSPLAFQSLPKSALRRLWLGPTTLVYVILLQCFLREPFWYDEDLQHMYKASVQPY